MRNNASRSRKKIAILGSGVGAMTTAFALTDPDNPRHNDYQITVYQMGWRLGGKGASGRNADRASRIEEHGLHIWFGSYDNAFAVIRKCYEELNRPPDAPLATWDAAFKPHSGIVLRELINGEWVNWPASLPCNGETPGDGKLLLPLWEYVEMAVKYIHDLGKKAAAVGAASAADQPLHEHPGLAGLLEELAADVEDEAASVGIKLLHASHKLVKTHGFGSEFLLTVLKALMGWLWERYRGELDSDTERREWILFNFTYANICGLIKEDAFERGLDVLNDYDYREFLLKYGYDDGGFMANSGWVLGVYDGVFAFVDGDNSIPDGERFPPHAKVEAGNVIRAGFRQFFAYKGASIWKMQAGMGDTIFAPLYLVLKRRGVEFEFFHQVRQVIPSADGQQIERIVIDRQVGITQEQQAQGGYDPLIHVKGLPCWPSTPNYDQIVQGDALKEQGIDLESYASGWTPVEKGRTLTVGEDFDEVVMGISLGAVPYVCCELVKSSAKWRRMVESMKTVRTQAFQLWLSPTAYELGWEVMGRPIVTGYEVSPFDTWADMTHLVDREAWPADHHPLNLSYFCGVMPDSAAMTECGPTEPPEELQQAEQDEKAKRTAIEFLQRYVGDLWPRAVSSNGGLDWRLLVDVSTGLKGGAEKFDSQFWRANVQPSERYVLSVPGSSKHRLPANDRDEFRNLFLAGDWTDNGFNVGCVEAATMSGLLASGALSGYPDRKSIVGVDLGAGSESTT